MEESSRGGRSPELTLASPFLPDLIILKHIEYILYGKFWDIKSSNLQSYWIESLLCKNHRGINYTLR